MRMTPMIVDERIVCRSVIRVELMIAGMSLNKRYTVMHYVYGELLIEMEDNVYCKTMMGYFLSLFFCIKKYVQIPEFFLYIE
uniref:Uncharacterized protein n=1 Tax=Virgibacillus oceani TaxID=1479511 RepID=A0A917H538_9BACI|nr:hypothetical protein GCM10011398_10140 [Virgibacillus oceani]